MQNTIPEELLNIFSEAARYRALQNQASLIDPYDRGGVTYSSWNWTIELPTGKSKGCSPPDDTPNFQQTMDAKVPHTLELEEIIESLSPELFEKLNTLFKGS